MNREQTRKAIEVMQAFVDGKECEFRALARQDMGWNDAAAPCWDWETTEYRIKPEPRVIYAPENADKQLIYCLVDSPNKCRGHSTAKRMVRFVEDLDWKEGDS